MASVPVGSAGAGLVGALAVRTGSRAIRSATSLVWPASAPATPIQTELAAAGVFFAAVAFLVVLSIGSVMVAIVPGYVDTIVHMTGNRPYHYYRYGLGVEVAVLAIIILAVITTAGLALFVIVPILVVVQGVGFSMGFMMLADRVTDRRWLRVLGAACVAGAVFLVPLLGLVVVGILGTIGLGAMVGEWGTRS